MILNWKLYLKCPVLSKKKKDAKKQKSMFFMQEKISIKTVPEDLLDLVHKALISTVINIFKELEKTIFKESMRKVSLHLFVCGLNILPSVLPHRDYQ